MPKVPFKKYSGCGNDFILIDDRIPFLTYWDKSLIQRLCQRGGEIGADGLILLQKSETADVKMRIFNADGSEAEMCGNGLRCLAEFMLDLGFERKGYRVETLKKHLNVESLGESVRASMGPPEKVEWKIPLKIEGKLYETHFLDTGVPHAVLFMEEIDSFPVEDIGRKIRFHKCFSPKGANANFAKILPEGGIDLRTYERGVEKETLACGTGATATALAAAHLYALSSPITINTRSGEKIVIEFSLSPSGEVEAVFQTGPVAKHLSGVFKIQRNEVV